MAWKKIETWKDDGKPILVIFESTTGPEAVVVKYKPSYDKDPFVWETVEGAEGVLNKDFVSWWMPIEEFPQEIKDDWTKILKPMHVTEGRFTEWEETFVWFPVKTEQGNWIWLKKTWMRAFYPAGWFCVQGPIWEYSDLKRGFWDDLCWENSNVQL